MLRPSRLGLAAVAVVSLASITNKALAADIGGRRHDSFGGYSGSDNAAFAPLAFPAGVEVIFPYDYYPFYGNHLTGTACTFERRPISGIHGLGWRNFIVCYN